MDCGDFSCESKHWRWKALWCFSQCRNGVRLRLGVPLPVLTVHAVPQHVCVYPSSSPQACVCILHTSPSQFQPDNIKYLFPSHHDGSRYPWLSHLTRNRITGRINPLQSKRTHSLCSCWVPAGPSFCIFGCIRHAAWKTKSRPQLRRFSTQLRNKIFLNPSNNTKNRVLWCFQVTLQNAIVLHWYYPVANIFVSSGKKIWIRHPIWKSRSCSRLQFCSMLPQYTILLNIYIHNKAVQILSTSVSQLRFKVRCLWIRHTTWKSVSSTTAAFLFSSQIWFSSFRHLTWETHAFSPNAAFPNPASKCSLKRE